MNPEWICHRGIRRKASENSLEAFRAARELGFKRLETDLRTSTDGHIVLSHDDSLQRVTGHAGLVSKLTRSELEKIVIATSPVIASEAKQSLMFFDQLIAEFSDLDWIFDIKPECAVETIAALLKWARANKTEDWLIKNVRFAFWTKAHETLLLDYLPKATLYANKNECIKVGMSLLSRLPLSLSIVKGRTYSLPKLWNGFEFFKSSYVERLHAAGSKALAFLPENAQDIKKAIEAGFDELLVDDGTPPSS